MKDNNCKADLHIKQSGSTIFLNVCGCVWGVCFGGCGLVGGAVRQQSHKHIWRSLQRQSCRVTQLHSVQSGSDESPHSARLITQTGGRSTVRDDSRHQPEPGDLL